MNEEQRKEYIGHKGIASVVQYEKDKFFVETLQTGTEIKSDLGNLSFVSEYAVRSWLSEDSVKDYLNAEFRKENQTLKKAAITEIINTVIFFAVIIVLIILIK